MSKNFLTTYIASNDIQAIPDFINDEKILREDILTIVAGPNYQILYYYVELTDQLIAWSKERQEERANREALELEAILINYKPKGDE